MDTKDTKSCSKVAQEFCCMICDYTTSKKSSYKKHILTAKHYKNEKRYKKIQKVSQKLLIDPHELHTCSCNKTFKYHSGLWRHKKNCFKTNIEPNIEINKEKLIEDKPEGLNNNILMDKDIIMLLINENKEFKQMILDQNKTIIELSKNNMNVTNNNNTNNSHNKTFNLQFFLNEECKDALNISEFVSSIRVELEDLETTGRLGYVEGVSRIINKNLNDLDQSKRPIHCSDLKREVLYIKNDDQWTKEDENKTVIKKVIKQVANENIKQIGEWRKKYPDCMDSESRKNDTYLKIVSNSMSGLTSEEQSKNINKIVTNVAKEAVIDK